MLTDKNCFEVIICDADEAADPRLWIGIDRNKPDVIHTDYPHDSPNYR